MIIQVHMDNHLRGSQDWTAHVESVVAAAVDRFGGQVTRVEVHFSDETGGTKEKADDKRCLLEARLAGMKPISVSNDASNLEEALAGAADKLEKTLERSLGKLHQAKGRTPYGGEVDR